MALVDCLVWQEIGSTAESSPPDQCARSRVQQRQSENDALRLGCLNEYAKVAEDKVFRNRLCVWALPEPDRSPRGSSGHESSRCCRSDGRPVRGCARREHRRDKWKAAASRNRRLPSPRGRRLLSGQPCDRCPEPARDRCGQAQKRECGPSARSSIGLRVPESGQDSQPRPEGLYSRNTMLRGSA